MNVMMSDRRPVIVTKDTVSVQFLAASDGDRRQLSPDVLPIHRPPPQRPPDRL